MEGSDGSPPSSLWMIRAAELFPKPQMEKEDEQLTVPFQELAGEATKYLGRTDDGVLALSNYRLFLLKNSTNSETSVPLGLIESALGRDLFHLIINCKDASTVKCSFETAEQCSEWQRRISLSVGVPESLESLFAFPFYSWTSDSTATGGDNNDWSGRLQRAGRFEEDFRREVERLQFDLNGTWRITHANDEYKLCPSYPPLILVPCCISDETLQNVANFRGSRRLPAVCWRHKQSGAVIARCSQPEVGWLGWRNSKDEQLLKALADACAFDRGEQTRRQNLCTSGESTPSSAEGSHEEVCMDEVRKILIVDARSYTSAVTNRARGGGCECIEYYPCAEIEFMNLGNIHAIRKSFHALRQLCASPPDVPNWLGLLERTMWLQHLSGLLAASMTVCHAIEKKGRPVLVHCSDGWDRTPQIVATAQLCLDPFYRTVEGFRILVEREWLSFGHKFADRCGHGPGSDELNERCPVFLQWLDLVHQIHRQFPCSFEFSMAYLIKLAQHSHSCLFGTFLCNTSKERISNSVLERTFSVWPFLSGPIYRNPLYLPNREKVLWPAHNVRDLALWSEVYLGSLGNQNSSDFPPNNNDGNQESTSPMIKTRSYGDLITAGGTLNGLTRRSSDPNMTVDAHLMMTLNHSDNNSVVDLSSERDETSPDIITNIIHDTTEKLQNLTNELNQSDEEICKINNFDNRKISNEFIIQAPQQEQLQQRQEPLQPLQQQQFQQQKQDITTDQIKYNIKCEQNGVNNDINQFVIGNSSPFESATSHTLKDIVTLKNGHDLIEESRRNLNNNINNINNEDVVDGVSPNNDINDSIIDSDLMQSVDLKDTLSNNYETNSSIDSQNHWYGSINTSTDTLVPIESQQQIDFGDQEVPMILSQENTNLNNNNNNHNDYIDNKISLEDIQKKETTKNLYKILNNLPEVHCKPKLSSTTTAATTAVTTISSSVNNQQSINLGMDESILIMPEYQKLEISNSGKCDTISNIIGTTSSHRRRRTSSTNSKNDVTSPNKNINYGSTTNSRFSTPGVRSLPLTPPGAPDRPSVAISCPDGLAHALSEQNIRLQQIVYEHKLREDALQRELYGMRMALLKKTCPHCNNQQINDEQEDVMMMSEESKLVELCDCCSSVRRNFGDLDPFYFGTSPESATSALDNIENLSICSWEAVEDRSGPSSGASSAQACGVTSSSVLWVPDHAVSRCTGCQTEFWLGRRKHHCRSCGQIFCADCSEFWAPLPDERLYNPVRLCGPCYHSVTTRIQQSIRSSTCGNGNSCINNQQLPIITTVTSSSTSTLSSGASTAVTTTLSNNNSSVVNSATLGACKHAASPPRNDRGPLKATTASN